MTRMAWAAGALMIGVSVALTGCGPNYAARAVVKGQVTLDGKPLTYGIVTFRASDGRTGSATIDPKGIYTMNDAPIGDVAVLVSVPKQTAAMKGMPGMPPAGTKAAPPKGIPMESPEGVKMAVAKGVDPSQIVYIPEKYVSAESSGLTYTVTSGEQTHNLPLTK
jgi:hypothetical protein